MSVTRTHFAQRILAALGLDAYSTIDDAEDKYVSSSTLSAHGIHRFVVPYYEALNGNTQCQLVQRGVNDTYLITAGRSRYSLKVYRLHWRSPEQIVDELRCIEHLADSGVLVAAAIYRTDKSLVTRIPTPEGSRYAVLHEWIPGTIPSFTDQAHSELIGRNMARLHAAGDLLPPSQLRTRLDMSGLFDRPIARIRSHIEHKPAQLSRFNALVSRLAALVQQASAELRDWGFCHGDAAHVNVRLDGDRVYFFDFEVCGPGWRLYDLATYIWAALYIGHVRDFRWGPIVQSYFGERPQFADSARFVPLFVVLRHFWYAAQIISLAPYLGANVMSNKFFEDLLAFCEQVDLHRIE